MLKYLAIALIVPLLVSIFAITVSYFNPPSLGTTPVYIGGLAYSVFTLTPSNEPVLIALTNDLAQSITSFTPVAGYRYEVVFSINKYYLSRLRGVKSIQAYLVKPPSGVVYNYRGVVKWSVANRLVNILKYSRITKFNLGVDRIALEYYNLTSQLSGAELRIAYIIVFSPNTTLYDIGVTYKFASNIGPYTKLNHVVSEAIKGNYTYEALVFDIEYVFERTLLPMIKVEIEASIAPDIYTYSRIVFVVAIALLLIVIDYYRNPEQYRWLRKLLKPTRKTG